MTHSPGAQFTCSRTEELKLYTALHTPWQQTGDAFPSLCQWRPAQQQHQRDVYIREKSIGDERSTWTFAKETQSHGDWTRASSHESTRWIRVMRRPALDFLFSQYVVLLAVNNASSADHYSFQVQVLMKVEINIWRPTYSIAACLPSSTARGPDK
jgi:hypothetical protein